MSSGSKEFYTSTYILASLDWSESSISVSDNTSKVTASLWYKRTNTYGGSTDDWGNPFWILIDGTWYNIGSGFSIPGYDNSWHKVGEASKSITHSNDGSKSITIGCQHNTSGSLFNCDESWTVALDTIPRASVPTIAPSTLLLSEAQNTITVNTNRKSSSFTHNMRLEVGDQRYYADGVGESTTFDIPYTDISEFSSTSPTLTGYLYCTTYNGSTPIGDTQRTSFTLSIDTSKEHPNVGTITLTDTNSASAAIETSGTFIKNASNLRAVISLSAVGSYTQLASAVVQCGNTQQTYALSGTSKTITFNYNKLDANSLIVTVYDKRGTSRTSTRNWTLVPYRDLTVTGSVDRTSETGSTITFSLQGDCFAGSFGNTTNTITVDYKWKLSSDTDYTTVANAFTFTPSGSGETTFTYSNTLTGFDYDKQYNLIFTVKDMFTSATTRVLTLTVGIPVWAYGKDWFGVYGSQYLHFDRDNPNYYYSLPESFNGVQYYDGIKNLLPKGTTRTVNGVTFTVDDIGVVTVNGTATAYTTWGIGFTWGYGTGNYYFSGCADGGSSTKYDCFMWDADASARAKKWDGSTNSESCYGSSLGESQQVRLVNGTRYSFDIRVQEGVTVSNLKFYPMIRHESIASNAFIPHAPTNRELESLFSNVVRYDTSGIWFRIQIGKILILLCTNQTGGQLQFGVTFDSVPFVLTGASQGSYGHGTTNQQIWDLTTSSMRWDARYGETTKYPASLMVIGLYSGQI